MTIPGDPGQPDLVNRLLADHIEMAGSGEAGVAAGSEIMTVQALRVEEIGELEELTGKPVLPNMLVKPGPREGPQS